MSIYALGPAFLIANGTSNLLRRAAHVTFWWPLDDRAPLGVSECSPWEQTEALGRKGTWLWNGVLSHLVHTATRPRTPTG